MCILTFLPAAPLSHRVGTHRVAIAISGVHPIMEKSALAGEGGGCTSTLFQPITITYKFAVYTPAERADTLPLFHPFFLFHLNLKPI